MINEFIYLSESKRHVSVICPSCKKNLIISKDNIKYGNASNFVLENKKKCDCSFESFILNRTFLKESKVKNFFLGYLFIIVALGAFTALWLLQAKNNGSRGDLPPFLTVSIFIATLVLLVLAAFFFTRTRRLYEDKDDIEQIRQADIEAELNEIAVLLKNRYAEAAKPEHCESVTVISNKLELKNMEYFFWKTVDAINLFPKYDKDAPLRELLDNAKATTIALDKIKAVHMHDKAAAEYPEQEAPAARVAQLVFIDEENREQTISFEFRDEQIQIKDIPDEISGAAVRKRERQEVEAGAGDDTDGEIKKQIWVLTELRDEGIITENEFQAKIKEFRR